MENRVAVFIDFENIKRAVDDYAPNERVDLKRLLDEIQRVADGRIVLKKAYADWGAYKDYRSDLLDSATEAVQAFALNYKGKNATDIRICIDVMDVVLRQADISHVAIVSGDSDFTPLVMKLREFGKYVLGLGVRSNTSNYLAKACDRFSFYDDLLAADSEAASGASRPAGPMDPVALLAVALADLGNRAVPGSALKMQMRKVDPTFDETRYGHASFLDFLRAHEDRLDIYKPGVGDLTVAPRRALGSEEGEGEGASPRVRESLFSAETYGGGSPATPSPTLADRYRVWLRENNFRYVPSAERHEIIRVVHDIFREADSDGISLKEAKDRLHLWFETNRPAVPWESINSTVYHLFYTWCFHFDRSESPEGRQLWDRRTTLQADIHSGDDLITKCERGIVRKLWERDRDIDLGAVNQWLYEGDPDRRDYVADLIEKVASTASTPRPISAVPGGSAN